MKPGAGPGDTLWVAPYPGWSVILRLKWRVLFSSITSECDCRHGTQYKDRPGGQRRRRTPHLTASLASLSPSRHCCLSAVQFQQGDTSTWDAYGLSPIAGHVSKDLSHIRLRQKLSLPLETEASAVITCLCPNDKAAQFLPLVSELGGNSLGSYYQGWPC